jgi:hypothetical protein
MAIELVEAVYCTPVRNQPTRGAEWSVTSRYKHFGFDFKGACQAIADNSGVGYVRTTTRAGEITYWSIAEPQLSLFEVIRGK